MTRKKASSPKNNRPRSAPKKSRRTLWLLALLLLLVATTLYASFYLIFLHDPDSWQDDTIMAPGQEVSAGISLPSSPPRYEEPGYEPVIPPVLPPPQAPPGKDDTPAPKEKPLLAIVIDDMGHRRDIGRELLGLGLPLSFAFLPTAPHSASLQAEAEKFGREILLHLPLEATDPRWNADPDTLTTAMDAGEISRRLEAQLRTVPKAIGINNHMGSLFTADPEAMTRLLTAIKKQHPGLFFLDSLTSEKSLACEYARQLGVKTARRQVFLDNEQDLNAIVAQIELLLETAEQHGQAIGIGHPYPATLEALRRSRSEILRRTQMPGLGRMVH